MTGLEQIREYLRTLGDGQVVNPKDRTHFMELMTLMKAGLDELAQTESVHYSSNSLNAVIKFVDGKRYLITISEVANGNE